MAEVSVQGLTKYYGDARAVEDFSIDAKDKEFLTILGPSGCGKTSILRMIAGLETPTKGDILIGGKSVLDVPTRDRNIAMVFQGYALYNHMTVHDNIAFPLKMHKTPEQFASVKIKQVAEMLGISNLLSRKPGKLSGGEQQRVALARAMVREPSVFLMDEPLTFLDPKLRNQMRIELKALQRRLGITMIYVTHDQAEAMTMSDRVALLESGVLKQVGTPTEVYNEPKNMFVAGFLGSPTINLLEGRYFEKKESRYIEKNGDDIGRAILDLGTFKLDITEMKDAVAKRSSDELVLGIRPEDIELSTAATKKVAEAIEAEVYLLEPLGSETIVDVKTGEKVLKIKTAASSQFEVGEKVWAVLNRRKIHIFDKSGETLV